jgi:hypothetical protein
MRKTPTQPSGGSKAVNGVPGLDPAAETADDYLAEEGSREEKVDALIRWQVITAGTPGFLSGIGGFLTLPVTLPANLTSVVYSQVRIIAAIAHMGGYDLKADRVQTLVYACLCGNAAKDILKATGMTIGVRHEAQKCNERKSLLIIQVIDKPLGRSVRWMQAGGETAAPERYW